MNNLLLIKKLISINFFNYFEQVNKKWDRKNLSILINQTCLKKTQIKNNEKDNNDTLHVHRSVQTSAWSRMHTHHEKKKLAQMINAYKKEKSKV